MYFVYPEGKLKALTLSYDDGELFDKELVEILNKYGLKATFHLNSKHLSDGKYFLQYVPRAEVKELYEGHEVACHGENHYSMYNLSRQRALLEVLEDRRELEHLTGKMVHGMSYAFGHYSDKAKEVLKAAGIKYSRTAVSTGNFYTPADFLEWHPTCHHDENLMGLAQKFLNVPNYVELPLMYVWGHSFEFGRSGNWKQIEEFAAFISGKEDIWYATNMEVYEYVKAIRSLEYSADGLTVYNPTTHSVWYRTWDSIHEIKSGETVRLNER